MSKFGLAALLAIFLFMAVAPVACVNLAIHTGILVKKEPQP